MKDEGVSLLGTVLLQRLWILFLVKNKKSNTIHWIIIIGQNSAFRVNSCKDIALQTQ